MEVKNVESFEEKFAKIRKKTTQQYPQYVEYGKLPPQATSVEEAVLGALMLEKDAIIQILDTLSNPDVFYKEEHKEIFKAILNLFEKTKPIDILTVTSELRQAGKLEVVGGAYYISELTNQVASSANIEFHARILVEKFILRELIRISNEIQQDAFEETTDVFELLNKAEKELYNISEGTLKSNYTPMSSLIKNTLINLEELSNNREKGGFSGIPSGFTELDRLTSGWQNSDLIIIASRPGMGKTSFVLSMARNMAVDFKMPVAIFSLEMSSLQLVNRLISAEAELDSKKLRNGELEGYEWEQLHKKISDLSRAEIFIDDTPAINIFEIRAKCRRLKQQHGIKLIIIDYLQLMNAHSDPRKIGNREQEISSISRSLKSLAKELDIPVIALSQLSREVEKRGGTKRPILSDLRESGSIEQDADQVIFIYRPEYYDLTEDEDGNPTRGIAEILMAKNRHGALKKINLKFVEAYAKFANIEDFMISTDQDGSITLPSSMNDDDEPAPF